MGVDKYPGKKRTGYGVDSSFKGKRIRERVGSNKKEAAEYPGKKLKEIRDGKFRKGPERVVLFDELIAEYEKQAEAKKNYRNERYYIGATVDREMACLRAMLNKAVKWELIPKNPASPEWKVWQKAVTNLEGAEKANSSIEAQSIGIAGA